MKIIIEIETGNAAIQTGQDLYDVLHKLSLKVQYYGNLEEELDQDSIRDSNGNTIGRLRTEQEPA